MESFPNGDEHGAQDFMLLNGHVDATSKGITLENSGSKGKEKLQTLKEKTKAKTKRIFHQNNSKSSDGKLGDGDNDVTLCIGDDPVFNPSKVIKKHRVTAGGIADTTIGALQTVTTAIVHPKMAAVNKATRTTAGKLSKSERPFSTLQSDLEFLEAHDDLHRAQSSEPSRRTSMDTEGTDLTQSFQHRVEELEAHREKLLAAWTTSRNVERVRVVPKRYIEFPEREAFIERDAHGKVVRYRWEKWLGYVLLFYTQDFSAQYVDDFDELPFDILTVRKNVQRLMMASAPWQAWLMDVRSVYRWEDPWKTGRWLAVYLVLWYTEHLVGFVWGYILYLVLKNRYYPTTYQSLKEYISRALDEKGTAYRLGELMDKYGPDGWIEPLMDELGPSIQLQLGDIANMLEVFINFYGWKSPRKTRDTLIFFAACLLVSLLADTKFCVKVFWFVAGGAFFISWPISSHYPKYRYLVSPFKWILWDIPTHAEWSFQYLRRQAQIIREEIIKRKVEQNYITESTKRSKNQFPLMPTLDIPDYDPNSESDDDDWHSVNSSKSILDSSDIVSFRAEWHKALGRLVIYSSGVRFVRSLPRKEMWRRSFLELTEMRKTRGSNISKLTMMAVEQLELTFIDGSSVTVEILKDRDEAFNTIIGFSALQWQVLQPGPGKGNGTGSGGNGRLFGRL